ncbi:hypothetical protein [Notoacmeibacter sp. MSK16QG-6]|uniref:hypothetical protein n=1 Tax=Notoacmeibacter sp. MSK16QG-6 TaxID=2957982 RepID=UPI0020A07F97|nr:hypothetical protein [Notoacmeibacter sp. MSK16QG-6]MCP1200087.1 hypothetical protein [Notoacmeibacter sp. MSK16QG-6]
MSRLSSAGAANLFDPLALPRPYAVEAATRTALLFLVGGAALIAALACLAAQVTP